MTSEKQILANRRNAQRSTGPRSAEGKAHSRLNATRHGLAGAGVGLPQEDTRKCQERLAEWAEQLGPRDAIESYLVETAVVASVRIDRCVRAEFTLSEERRRDTIRSWERHEEERLQALIPGVQGGQNRALPELLKFSTGCEWLMFQWEFFRDGLRALGHLDANNLAGSKALVRCRHAGDLEQLNAVAKQAREGAEAAREEIEQIIEAELDALEALRDELWSKVEAPCVAQALEAEAFDASPRAQLMRRYETACRNDLLRALRELTRIRKENLLTPQEPETTPTPIPAACEDLPNVGDPAVEPEPACEAALQNEAISAPTESARVFPESTSASKPSDSKARRAARRARRRQSRAAQRQPALAAAGASGPAWS